MAVSLRQQFNLYGYLRDWEYVGAVAHGSSYKSYSVPDVRLYQYVDGSFWMEYGFRKKVPKPLTWLFT